MKAAAVRREAGLRVIGNLADPDGMGRTMTEYLAWMRERNYAAATIESRGFYLERFCGWCEDRGILRPSEVTRPILERYRSHLFHYRRKDGRPMVVRSQYSRLQAVKMLFSWAAKQNRILYNPASELELPKLEHRLPRDVLTAEEAELVMLQPHLWEPMGLRDRAILEVLYSTGIRRGEASRLTVWDLDREQGTLLVRQGKGRRDRRVPIGDRALAWVDKYLADVRPLLLRDLQEDNLFLNRMGEPLSYMVLGEAVRRCITAAKIGKLGSCHLFRHTCATLMLEGGADLRYVQEMLGHVNIETTTVYTHVSIRQLKAVHTLTHPAAGNQRRRVPELSGAELEGAEEFLTSLAAEADEEEAGEDLGELE